MEGAILFVFEKVWDLLNRQTELLQGVNEQVDELRRELRILQSLLQDADAKKHESKRVKNFLEEVKDILYDAEDLIEINILKDVKKENGIEKYVRRLACFLVDRRKFALDIEGITKRTSKMIERMQSFGIQQIIDGGRSLSFQERQKEETEIQQTFPNKYESDLLGVEQSVKELVSHLVRNDNIQMVSITGMGGIGKTTLAKQVFHHYIVRRHFDGFTWFSVSKNFTRKDVWQRILKDLGPQDMDILQLDEYTLQGRLFHMLETGRYLVVLDDVWREEDWDRIKSVFPRTRGWKMLLTSRNAGVGLHADPTCFTFRPRILTPEESWTLCGSIAFARRYETGFWVDEEMEAIGKEMVTYCGGLPLAIKVLGGLLAKKHTVLEWKGVYDTIGHHVGGSGIFDDKNFSLVSRVLSLSYEDLPRRLKHCFLFLAHYPEKFQIAVNKLSYYWAAEGIITSFYDGASILESGESCLQELVSRNMVIVEKQYLPSPGLYCQMHDLMRDLCLSKAKEENFLQFIKVPTSTSTINSQSCSTSRRLAVHCGNAFEVLSHRNNQKVRSLLFFDVIKDVWRQICPPLLRVLDLYKVQFEEEKLPSSIGELVHLRFLSLLQAGVSHLPCSLRKLKLLLYLNLTVNGKSVYVPNVLKELLELRCLQLPRSMHDQTLLQLGDLLKLETLLFFSTKHSKVTDLIHMTRLRNLKVCISGECSFETLSSSLQEMRDLKKLNLLDSRGKHGVTYHGGEFVMNFIHLNYLGLSVHMPRFSDLHRFPPQLANVMLHNCYMEEDPMPILEKLFHLESISLDFGAFAGKKMVCSKGGYLKLCVLKLYGQLKLEEWVIEEDSMPCLRILTIRKCKRLMKIPYGVKYISSLKELHIKQMKRNWMEKLVPGGEDYYKVQHIPSVQFIDCNDE